MLWAKRGWESDRFFLPGQQMAFPGDRSLCPLLAILTRAIDGSLPQCGKVPDAGKGCKALPNALHGS